MKRPTKPEKKKPSVAIPNAHYHSECGYDRAIDDCRAYYESPQYIQELIDSGKIVIDESKIAFILFDTNKLPYYEDSERMFEDESDELEKCRELSRAIANSKDIIVYKGESNQNQKQEEFAKKITDLYREQ